MPIKTFPVPSRGIGREDYTISPATTVLTVAAYNSSIKARAFADYRCDGTNDHVEIQAALDALPAWGGEVRLLAGTYNCEVTINLDSSQTLRGSGRNTILTTSTWNLTLLRIAGVAGADKVEIYISDLQIDGANFADVGIWIEYTNTSLIENLYVVRNDGGAWNTGIILADDANFNRIVNNTFTENHIGINLVGSDDNFILNNICEENFHGIWGFDAHRNMIGGNKCRRNTGHGILLESCDHNDVSSSICIENSQIADDSRSGIHLDGTSSYNSVHNNICLQGALVNKPRYGINIAAVTCTFNMVHGNNLYDSGKTGDLNDDGINTRKRDNIGNAGAWLVDV